MMKRNFKKSQIETNYKQIIKTWQFSASNILSQSFWDTQDIAVQECITYGLLSSP